MVEYAFCNFELQKDLFSAFLESKGLGLKGAVVRNMDPKRLQMPWRDSINKLDCGVFMMCHMESYEGQAVKEWDCSLRKGDLEQLCTLRRQYLHTLCTTEINEHRVSIMKRAVEFEKSFSGSPTLRAT